MGEDNGGLEVGLVGDEATASRISEAVQSVRTGEPDDLLAADPDVVVAVGETGVLAVARRQPAVPILPVDAGPGLQSVSREAVADSLSRHGTDAWETVTRPLLAVEHDGERVGRALLDVTLVTAEPARISTYSLTTEDETVATVRADGLVVATPGGSSGYARDVRGPVVAPTADVLVAAPIAPFEMDPDTWILNGGAVSVTVTRDETPVVVLADDREVAQARAGEPVSVSPSGTVETVVLPESASPFGREHAELEKH